MPYDPTKEISEMIETIDSTVAPSTQSMSTEAPGTTAPGTTAPSTSAPGTSAPSTTAPTTDAPKEEDELTKTKRELESLRAKFNEVHDKKETKPTTKAPSTKAPSTAAPQEVDFVGDIEDLEDLMRDPKEFNKLLNKVFQQGVAKTKKELGEGVLRSIPDIVKLNVSTVIALREANEKFYKANEDLQPYKKVVAAAYESVASEHPDWTVDKVLEETANTARKTLELTSIANPKPDAKGKKSPSLPPGSKGKQASRPKPKTSGLLAEIEAMNQDLD